MSKYTWKRCGVYELWDVRKDGIFLRSFATEHEACDYIQEQMAKDLNEDGFADWVKESVDCSDIHCGLLTNVDLAHNTIEIRLPEEAMTSFCHGEVKVDLCKVRGE